MEPFIGWAMPARMRFAAALGGLFLCMACRTEPPDDEVPETSTARSRLTQLSERATLSWLAQPDVRFSRSGTRILVDAPHEDAPRARLELPVNATGFTSLTEEASGMTIRQRLEHAQLVTAESAKGLLFFRGALQGFDFFQRPSADQVEDFISFPTRPEQPRVSYEVELAQGVSGLRLVSGVLEFMDASGAPRLRVGPAHLLGADSQWHDVRVELEGCAADRNPATPWGRPVTAPGNSHCRVVFDWDDTQALYPAVFDPTWTITVGNMVSPRAMAQAVLLNNGRILMAGGISTYSPLTVLNSAELYDEMTGTWSPTGSMTWPRADFGMIFTTRSSPRAVAVGGYGSAAGLTLEWYDPTTGAWSPTKQLPLAIEFPGVVTLPDGNVAIIGGQYNNGTCIDRLTAAELYDPQANTVRLMPTAMSTGRVQHATTLLPDGRVLVTGGLGTCCNGPCVGELSSTEILNTDLTWSRGPDMQRTRSSHSSILLAGGTRVLVAGSTSTTQSEVYDIPSNSWSAFREMGAPRTLWDTHMTLISNSRVMLAGGAFTTASGDVSTNLTLIYDPVTNIWSTDNPLNVARRGHVQVRTALGRTLVAGGGDSSVTVLNTSEIHDALPNGAACTGNGLCASKLCVDGVCCNTACDKACDACNLPSAPGTCTTVPVSTPGNPACQNHLVCSGTSADCPTVCASDAWCESGYYCLSGTCQLKKPNGQTCGGANQCQSAFCVDGVCCNSACSGACDACNLTTPGTCTNMSLGSPGNPVCPNHFVCSGTSADCPTLCANDTTCESGYYCLSGACLLKNPNGHSCDGANQCQSNFCVDGVCCNSACAGACDACNLSNSSGTCTPLPLGTPGMPTCPNHFVCNGTGTSCPPVCTSDLMCESGYYCLNGACRTKNPNGQPCDATNQCQSGFCVDGVCCNSACGNACDACNLGVSVGTCSNVPAGTPEEVCGAYLCSGLSPSCPPACTTNQQCRAPALCINDKCQEPQPPGQPCTEASQCQSGFCADGVCCNTRCDGSCESCGVSGSLGTCKALAQGTPGEPVCAPYVCDGSGGACPTHCTADNQCAAGAFCEHGTCSTDARGHIGWACGCGSAPEGSAFFALILLGLLALRRSEVRP
ncbi:MAG: hypothetical protein ACJ8AT_25245 [Hyalangium sp.]|uniref:hypothetical protein n=1 Tax=Hyalangium sp. TaxID=2028555 RepID=UPI003899EB1A